MIEIKTFRVKALIITGHTTLYPHWTTITYNGKLVIDCLEGLACPDLFSFFHLA